MSVRKTIESTIARATEPTLVSWPVFIAVAFMSVVLHLFASPDLEYTNLGIRAVFALTSTLPMFAIIALAVLVKLPSQRAKAVLVVSSFFVGGALRGVMLWALLNEIGIVDSLGLGLRLFLGSWNMGITVFIFGYLWNSYLSYVGSIREKSLDNKQLESSLSLIASETRLQNQNLVAEISQQIIDSLQSAQGYSTEEQISQLEELIQNKVSPLKQSLESESQSWLPAKLPRRLSFSDRIRNLKFAQSTPAPWLVIPLALAGFPIILADFGLDAAMRFVLLGVTFVLPPSALLLFLIRRHLSNSPRALQVIVISLAFLISGASGSVGTFLALIETGRPDQFLLQTPAAYFVYAWSITLALASRSGFLEVEKELAAIKRKLRWAIARASMVDLHNRRRLFRYLHGPVQSSIQSTIISLQRDPSPANKQNAFRGLVERLQDVKSPSWQGSDFKTRFQEIQQLWSGLCEISISSDEEVEKLIEKDSVLADHLGELLREVSSAVIRKLNSSRIDIQLAISNVNQLLVSISWPVSTEPTDLMQSTGLTEGLLAASITVNSETNNNQSSITLLLPGLHYLAIDVS